MVAKNIYEDNKCVMKGSGDCMGLIMRLQVGTDFMDLCVHHCVLLKQALIDEGF